MSVVVSPEDDALVERARWKAFGLYEGVRTPHRSCGIAIAETFGLPTASYQSLRRGGITGAGECGAIVAGRLVLGELLGDPDPNGPVTAALRAAMVEYFDGSDLNKNFDVKLEVGASLSQSTSIKTRLIIEAWNQNILDPSWRPKVLRALNIGTAEFDLREDVVDMEKAIRENQAFIDGKDQEKGAVEWFVHDDHRLHMEYHTTLAKTEEFKSWPDERKARLLEHINLHMQVLALIDQAAQGIVPGAAGGASPQAPGVAGTIPPGGGKPGPVAANPGSEPVPGAGGGSQAPAV